MEPQADNINLLNSALSFIGKVARMVGPYPEKTKFPAKLQKERVKKVSTKHTDHWHTVEMIDGGFALVFNPKDLIAFYSTQLSDLDVLKLFYNEFDEIHKSRNSESIINRIVELILKDSSFDPLYYATAAGFTEYVEQRLKNEKNRVLHGSITKHDDTCAHIAALHNQDVKFYLEKGYNPLTKNKNGETIAHYGAKNLDALRGMQEALRYDFFKLISAEDKDKRTAIHSALMNKDCMEYLSKRCPQAFGHQCSMPLITVVQEVSKEDSDYIEKLCEKLKVDPNFLVRINPDTKETILHSSLDSKVLRILLRYCKTEHLEFKDSTGKTPLHSAVIRKDLEAVLALISYGAIVDSVDKTGKTPIYYAVKNDNVKSVKALLLFNAVVKNTEITTREVRIVLDAGSKSYYESENRRRYEFDSRNFDHFALKKTIEKFRNVNASEFFNALSFDGGGMRGLVSLQILREIENRCTTQQNFLRTVESMGGTSTGSILMLALTKYKDLDKVTRLYLRMKDDIFNGSRPYNGDVLEKLLKEELGEVTLQDFGRSKAMRLIVTATRVDVSPPKLAVFRSFQITNGMEDPRFAPLENFSAAKVARCSSAAPTYFRSVGGKYMDGGIVANNPCCEILCDEHTISLSYPNLRKKMKIMLSIGTGQPPLKTCKNVDFAIPTSMTEVFATFNSLSHMAKVFLDQLTSADGANVDRAKLMASAMGVAFFRFSPPLTKDYELNEVRADELVEMMWETKLYMQTRLNDINIFLSLLG